MFEGRSSGSGSGSGSGDKEKQRTVFGHAEEEAFLEAAVLAAVAVDAVDDAVLLARALVVDDGALRAPEEALAALARDHAIVHARTLVAAHLARDDLDLRCVPIKSTTTKTKPSINQSPTKRERLGNTRRQVEEENRSQNDGNANKKTNRKRKKKKKTLGPFDPPAVLHRHSFFFSFIFLGMLLFSFSFSFHPSLTGGERGNGKKIKKKKKKRRRTR